MANTHYYALASLNNRISEILLDSGGARTMIDKETAVQLGLTIEWADENNFLGTFSGISATPVKYAGRAVGPITLKFNEKVTFNLQELRIFDFPEPIILIGTDLLGHAAKADYTFAYLGVNPVSKVGEIVFYDMKKGGVSICELVQAPKSHTTKNCLPPPTKNVSFGDPISTELGPKTD